MYGVAICRNALAIHWSASHTSELQYMVAEVCPDSCRRGCFKVVEVPTKGYEYLIP